MNIQQPFKLILIFLILCINKVSAQDFIHPAIISFEESTNQNWSTPSPSTIATSQAHYKHGTKSLQWNYEPNSELVADEKINFTPFDPNSKDKSIATFCVWVYNDTPKDEKVKFQFLTDDQINCEFEFGINFKGWRAAWVAFERDMQGKPETTMNKMKIIAPKDKSGTLFFDHIMLCTPADSRWNTPDYQIPFVNAKTKNHWLVLYKASLNKPNEKLSSLTVDQIQGIKTINKRYSETLINNLNVNKQLIDSLKTCYNKYHITRKGNQIKGASIWFCRFSEIYKPYTKKYKNYYNKKGKGFKAYTKLMLALASAYNLTDKVEYKKELESLFFNMSDHLMDQGWAAGSANGTLHHLGFSTRTYYAAYFLMRESLIRTKRAAQVQKAMEWYSGAKEVFAPIHGKGVSIDALNTSVIGRLGSILMLEDSPEKVRYLNAYVKWLGNGLMYAPGLKDSFKVDGSVFHHANNYPGYARGGFNGACKMVYFFNQTVFRVNEEGHNILKQALLKTRLFCNKKQWPISMSGRKPTGKGALSIDNYRLMAFAGTPDGKNKIDNEMAAAYLRLIQGDEDEKESEKFIRKLEGKNCIAEENPNGNWTMNYAALGIHRRDSWSATIQGHSRYLWAAEHYIGANYYGRYMKHGQIQIISKNQKSNEFSSGYNVEGWDWGRFAGTTAIHLPIEQLEANILNVDQVTGYEEMLISDEAFAGAISLEGKNGAWAMKLHEHDKYNGSHRATKSVFFFDNKIICLGSDIENINTEYNTETTLFQNHLERKKQAIFFNKTKIKEFPYTNNSVENEATLLTDNMGNSFYIPAANKIEIAKQLQYSKDQSSKADNQGHFTTAVINHGKAPKDANYEYAILVQSNHEQLISFAKQMLDKEKAAYSVLRKDSKAHVVNERETKTTAYALFEANEKLNIKGLKSISAPALVMIKDKGKSKIVSLCDPDLHLYEGEADVVIENGKRKERSVYSRDWTRNESEISKIQIKLEGEWSISANNYCKLVSSNANETVLEFTCQHGLTREVELIANN